jgi:hypothetical protein
MDQGIRHRASSHEGVAELIAEALLKSAIHIRRDVRHSSTVSKCNESLLLLQKRNWL